MLKITPSTLGREEMAWLWTALKADYRPTFPFQVSVVLIESKNPAMAAAGAGADKSQVEPDLTRFSHTITVISAGGPARRCFGHTRHRATGNHLLNATGVVLNNSLRGIQQTLPLLSPAAITRSTFHHPT